MIYEGLNGSYLMPLSPEMTLCHPFSIFTLYLSPHLLLYSLAIEFELASSVANLNSLG